MNKITDTNWTLEIRPRAGWLDINLAEIWRYRDLILLLVRRDFVSIYKQTILGPVWFFLQPLFTTIVFTVVFGNIAQIPTDGIPQILFYMAGIVAWTYFANCMTKTSNTFIENAGIFGKVYFPRLVVPISVVITNLLTFFIQFSLFLIFLGYYILVGSSVKLTLWIIVIPLLLIQMAALGLGMGILISSLTTKYRDLIFAVGFGVQLWMYATPIVYPLSQIPEKWQWIFALNPMTAIVEVFRYAFLGSGAIRPWVWEMSIIMTVIILIFGILLFNKVEKTFMDTV
ncbi:ABC transporter permease [Methanospirillum lacunae]|uniref:ABC transporter permease n=1 Tax=Methanospirillum lacunae TaxID=668570 RepID=A0A2V2N2G9_9EURY|nr:ABC transporter permease [Methanospirillum lacunae]PWR70708.1 ABC transporter permease [Methanospirillum lacunae]